jgi:hypothetical protein
VDAIPQHAGIGGACVVVIAVRSIAAVRRGAILTDRLEHTPRRFITTVNGATVVVITVQCFVYTLVTIGAGGAGEERTFVAVVAIAICGAGRSQSGAGGIRLIDALACRGIAEVKGTGVLIVAVLYVLEAVSDVDVAFGRGAEVVRSAICVFVTTGFAVRRRFELAARGRITGIARADDAVIAGAFGVFTVTCRGTAGDLAGTKEAIVRATRRRAAVGVGGAGLTVRDGLPDTQITIGMAEIHGAGVAVVASCRVQAAFVTGRYELVLTGHRARVTGVQGAVQAIAAGHGGDHAHTAEAYVNGTGVRVVALWVAGADAATKFWGDGVMDALGAHFKRGITVILRTVVAVVAVLIFVQTGPAQRVAAIRRAQIVVRATLDFVFTGSRRRIAGIDGAGTGVVTVLACRLTGTGDGIAEFDGALIAVVTGQWHVVTDAIATLVERAVVSVVTDDSFKLTGAGALVTRVGCAVVGIGTDHRLTDALTGLTAAEVERAQVTVLAVFGRELARAGLGVAGVGGTDQTVAAVVRQALALAGSGVARIDRADVSVTTVDRRPDATLSRLALVHSTRVGVVTEYGNRRAVSGDVVTFIVRTAVVVITGLRLGYTASRIDIANIVGAEVLIVAVLIGSDAHEEAGLCCRLAEVTLGGLTGLTDHRDLAVRVGLAGELAALLRRIDTADPIGTGVLGTGVSVIAGVRHMVAVAIDAEIEATWLSIVTGGLIELTDLSVRSLHTDVGRTGFAIVALIVAITRAEHARDQGVGTATRRPGLAGVDGAGFSVIAVIRNKLAAGRLVAGGHLTGV